LKRYCNLQKETPVTKLGLSVKTMSHKVSTVFHQERGFRYAIANEKFDANIHLLSECFSREPMGAAFGLSGPRLSASDRSLHSGMNEQWPFGYRNACGSLRDAGTGPRFVQPGFHASYLDRRQNGDIQC
jgi:hypothetical protein